MPNRRLDPGELERAREILAAVRKMLHDSAAGDMRLLFALRRKISKELVYDERTPPMARRRLKALKRTEQGGLCPECGNALPARYSVLDRVEAERRYVAEHVRLICQPCDQRTQQARGYR
jgi:rRNA maturation protein Nop10